MCEQLAAGVAGVLRVQLALQAARGHCCVSRARLQLKLKDSPLKGELLAADCCAARLIKGFGCL